MSSPTTAVPQPSFTANGFVAPAESSVLAGTLADVNSAFGNALNPGLRTPQGQLASSLAAEIGDANGQFTALANGVDPAYASGRMQDAIGRIYFMTRKPAQPTVLNIVCGGAAQQPIPLGALIRDESGNSYACNAAVTIPSGGSITTTFACTVSGPVPVPSTDGVSIYQTIPGWESVTCSGGIIGTNTESRAQFEARRIASVASNGTGFTDAVRGNLLAVNGVIDAYVIDNPSGSVESIGGTSVGPNALYCSVSGGTDNDVAEAIWIKKPPGCALGGTTAVSVSDQSTGYSIPPQYTVNFQKAVPTPIFFTVTLKNSPQVPSNATALVQGALLAAFTGADCTFNGSIAGTVLTVSSVSAGQIQVGQLVLGPEVLPGTAVSAPITGTGGAGTYTVSVAQTIATEPMSTGPVNPLEADTRPSIGALIFASQYYASIAMLGPWARIVSIQIGAMPGWPTLAQFTASISATTLTVTAIGTGGILAVGQYLFDAANSVPFGTSITALGTGGGGVGTYTISASLGTIGSEIMTTTARLPAASFIGNISANTLDVTAMNGGTIAVGEFIYGQNGDVPAGAVVTAFGSGSGGTGTYTLAVAAPGTIASELMASIATSANDVQLNINEIPVLAAFDVNVVLQ